MNAKEAMEIISKSMGTIDVAATQRYAQGFLEAVDKFKPVGAFLKMIARVDGYNDPQPYADKEAAKMALAIYRRDVLGES